MSWPRDGRGRGRGSLIQRKTDALASGSWLPIDLSEPGEVGAVPGPDVRAALLLATAYQAEADPDYCSVSWACQLRAQDYYNAHGLNATLIEIERLGGDLSCCPDGES